MNDITSDRDNAYATGLTALRITGSDCVEFLQGQLTQDVARVNPDSPLLAGWNSPKGRLLALGWLAEWQDAYWLLVPEELADSVARRLQMFVLRADVRIEAADISVSYAAADTSESSEEAKATDWNDEVFSFQPAAGMGRLLLSSAPAGQLPDPAALHWRRANLQAGLPSVTAATQEHFVPQMLNLDLLDAISFTKGCYVGQEIVARTQNLGRIKRRMYGFSGSVNAIPEPGASVYGDGKSLGEVVDAVVTGTDVMLLAVMRIEELAKSQVVSLDPEGGQQLQRRNLPYAVPEAL